MVSLVFPQLVVRFHLLFYSFVRNEWKCIRSDALLLDFKRVWKKYPNKIGHCLIFECPEHANNGNNGRKPKSLRNRIISVWINWRWKFNQNSKKIITGNGKPRCDIIALAHRMNTIMTNKSDIFWTRAIFNNLLFHFEFNRNADTK